MGTLHGIIRDSVSGNQLEAKVHVLTSNGQFVYPGRHVSNSRKNMFTLCMKGPAFTECKEIFETCRFMVRGAILDVVMNHHAESKKAD